MSPVEQEHEQADLREHADARDEHADSPEDVLLLGANGVVAAFENLELLAFAGESLDGLNSHHGFGDVKDHAVDQFTVADVLGLDDARERCRHEPQQRHDGQAGQREPGMDGQHVGQV